MTKASTLKFLNGKIKEAKILDFYFFTVNSYTKNKKGIIKNIENKFGKNFLLIIRSSAVDEDKMYKSSAGKYDSILNVKKNNLEKSIERVIKSYSKKSANNQVLVQPMLKNIYSSGVFFSIEPNKNTDYYVINYNLGGDSTKVTSGKKCISEFIYKNKYQEISQYSKRLINLFLELKKVLKSEKLDIEFAFDKKNELYLFQVRKIIVKRKSTKVCLIDSLKNIQRKISNINLSHPDIYGNKTILGVMPDWNPAEIIGVYPRPLAISIYKELVTDSIWSYQRDNYGYKRLRSFPLLIDLEGLPYIDTRLSFNSFIPKTMPEDISKKLVNLYLRQLKNQPYLHDKIEFDIVYSCFTFNLKKKLNLLKGKLFSKNQINIIFKSLLKLTNRIICPNGLWKEDLKKIDILDKRFENIKNSKFSEIDKIYWLIEDCKRYGTLPFAGLARGAFIAMQILDSLVDEKIISLENKLKFLNSMKTVNYWMQYDLRKLSKKKFLDKYGHLRPGTYDILSFRYDEKPDLYFDWKNIKKNKLKNINFKLNFLQKKQIKEKINLYKINQTPDGLFNFFKTVIEGREYAKYLFSRNISEIFRLLEVIGKDYNFKRNDLSFLNIKDLLKNYSSSSTISQEIKKSIEIGKKKFQKTEKIILPPIICNKNEVYNFVVKEQKPNFITNQKKVGLVAKNNIDIKNKIILIESADPGYDWIFTREIAGFVTAYGGINSHMSIRAMELNIPAVIGVGEKKLLELKNSKQILLDCSNHIIRDL